MKYEIIIYWSKEDDCYIAIVPELPGCMADGQTYSEALREIEAVMKNWLEIAEEMGREIPEPRGKLIQA